MSAGVELLDIQDQAIANHLGATKPGRYLREYLRDIGARSALLERHYVDRHYLSDYQDYYCRSFSPPEPYCQRLHFFAVDPRDLDRALDGAYENEGGCAAAERQLTAAYLGFVVRRPLARAQIGRTVLSTYPSDGYRQYKVVRPYRVHVAGLRLTVCGLAYQEQDQGAAVCASTALWCALQRVAHVAGKRTPTPSQITRAANSPLPASYGLEWPQMATALSSLGYIADVFAPGNNQILFRAEMAACLESQLPVVLLLSGRRQPNGNEVPGGHAVTVTGFRQPAAVAEVPMASPHVPPIAMRTGSLAVVYVHDDNLGCHAHYELFDREEKNGSSSLKLGIRRGRADKPNPDWWQPDEWTVTAAMVPKTDKMRLPIEQLFSDLVLFRDLLCNQVFGGLDLHFGVRFSSGIDFQRALLGRGFQHTDLRQFLQSLTLPRHIGVVSAYYGEVHLCDVVLDISEVTRGIPRPTAVVAPGVPVHSRAWLNLYQVAQHLPCPIIAAPPAE